MQGIVTLTRLDGKAHLALRISKTILRLLTQTDSYGTEPAVGKAIKKSGIPRDQLFVTSKLWNNRHHPDDVGLALQETLDDLGLEYLDLFLMHWPVAFQRGDEPFPTDKDEKLITADIDYIDVCVPPASDL
jgi:diketogulonate reductase-like aldo/keto reductase